jgi:Ran GTPase-activating protein (RanGAP) involved in mRNA processing and transport
LDLRTNKVGKLFCDEVLFDFEFVLIEFQYNYSVFQWLSHVSDRNSMSLNHLRELWLDNNTNVDLVSLSYALRTQTSFSEFRASQRCHLHTLSLSRCGLGDVTPLARVLSTMSTHINNPNLGFHLTRIDLSGNGVGDEGGRSIFLALTQASASPSHIDMSECKIGDQTSKVAAEFIRKSKFIVSIKFGTI